jgi:hypothetical protein
VLSEASQTISSCRGHGEEINQSPFGSVIATLVLFTRPATFSYPWALDARVSLVKRMPSGVLSPGCARSARGGEKIRQMRRFAESDKELARFYRENA